MLDKATHLEPVPLIVEEYLSLSVFERVSVYRRLSIKDRMRLSRMVKAKKIERNAGRKMRSLEQGPETAPSLTDNPERYFSDTFETHISQLVNLPSSNVGNKTADYLRRQLSSHRRG